MAGATSFDVYTEDSASQVFATLIRYEDGTTTPFDPNSPLELVRRTCIYAENNNIQLGTWDRGIIINGVRYEARFGCATNEIRQIANNYVIDPSLPLSAVASSDGSLIYIGASDLAYYLSLRRA